ncbi:MAG: motility associated factor glycosyltransferase family protein [Burkholderiales bacterium]
MLTVERGAEAMWRWLESELEGRPVPSFLVLIGFGNGDLLDLLDRHVPGTRVLALEPDPANAAAFRARPDVDARLASGRLVYLADPDYAGADEAWRIFPATGGEPTVLVHPELVLGAGVARASQVLKKILFGVEANAEARRKFAPRYLVNSIRNIPGIVRGGDIRELTDRYRGVPAIVAAAGPSLDDAMAHLGAFQDRGLIIAADTALRPLLLNGIAPSLVVGLDPSEANLRHFLALPECPDTWLVAESALDSRAVAPFGERTLWFRVSTHHPWPLLRELGIDVGQVDVWGSVLTAAFQTAVLAGCDPIVIVGADLAFTGGRPYARGTTYEFDWAWHAALGQDVQTTWQQQIARARPCAVPDVNGAETISSESLVAFRDWLVARVGRSGRQVVNASGAGILFGPGVQQAALADVQPHHAEVPGVARIHRGRAPDVRTAVADRLAAEARVLRQGTGSTVTIDQWKEFSGAGFEATAVAEALDHAVQAMTVRAAAPAALERTIDWSSALDSGSSVPHLADAVAVYRASFDDVAGKGRHDGAQSHEQLEHALTLLDEICQAVMRTSRLAPSVEPAADPLVPLSAASAWPEETRWAILAFEAALGRQSERRPEGAFFRQPVRLRGAGQQADAAVPPAASACCRVASEFPACVDESAETLTVPFVTGASEAHYARRITGTVRATPEIVSVRSSVRLVRLPLLKRPRALTDEGCRRALVVYEVERGAVCVSPHTDYSFIVGRDGANELRHAWPRRIVAELPFGEDGAVAWGNGLSTPDRVENGYVMYRSRAHGDVTIEDLPVRPSLGWWWDRRLYWSCFPTHIDSWIGLASWAPGEEVRTEVPDITLFDAVPSGDRLVLSPSTQQKGQPFERRLLTEGWSFRPGLPLEPVPFGGYGAPSSAASSMGWTATAYPEADVIGLTRDTSDNPAPVAMNCYYPLKVAWIGPSLLVSTADRELLLFEGLLGSLKS